MLSDQESIYIAAYPAQTVKREVFLEARRVWSYEPQQQMGSAKGLLSKAPSCTPTCAPTLYLDQLDTVGTSSHPEQIPQVKVLFLAGERAGLGQGCGTCAVSTRLLSPERRSRGIAGPCPVGSGRCVPPCGDHRRSHSRSLPAGGQKTGKVLAGHHQSILIHASTSGSVTGAVRALLSQGGRRGWVAALLPSSCLPSSVPWEECRRDGEGPGPAKLFQGARSSLPCLWMS